MHECGKMTKSEKEDILEHAHCETRYKQLIPTCALPLEYKDK